MLLTKVPGMTVFAPSSYEEVGNMLRRGAGHHLGPGGHPVAEDATPARSPTVGNGVRARKVRAGSQVCLLGVGKLVAACEEAARLLSGMGVEATVWDARVVAPLDPAMIEDALTHDLVVSVEDGIVEGGVGSLIDAALRRAAPARHGPTMVNCGVPTAYLPHGRASDILSGLGLDGQGISRTVLEHL